MFAKVFRTVRHFQVQTRAYFRGEAPALLANIGPSWKGRPLRRCRMKGQITLTYLSCLNIIKPFFSFSLAKRPNKLDRLPGFPELLSISKYKQKPTLGQLGWKGLPLHRCRMKRQITLTYPI